MWARWGGGRLAAEGRCVAAAGGTSERGAGMTRRGREMETLRGAVVTRRRCSRGERAWCRGTGHERLEVDAQAHTYRWTLDVVLMC